MATVNDFNGLRYVDRCVFMQILHIYAPYTHPNRDHKKRGYNMSEISLVSLSERDREAQELKEVLVMLIVFNILRCGRRSKRAESGGGGSEPVSNWHKMNAPLLWPS